MKVHTRGCFTALLLSVVLERYAKVIYRFQNWILAIALVCLCGAAYYASGVYGDLSQAGFSVPGSASAAVSTVVNDRFGGDPDSLVILFSSSTLLAQDAVFQQAEHAVLASLTRLPGVTTVTSYYNTHDPRFISRNSHESYALVGLRGTDDQQATAASQLMPRLKSPVLRVQAGGSAAINAAATDYVKQDLTRAELITFPITAVLLVIIFRSLAAAALPLAVGVYGIVGALVITRFVTLFTDISVYVMNLISLLGLGLAIDYSLFIVSRYREELAKCEGDEERALVCTISTAGRTVLFSALTVLIALAGLVIFPIDFLRSMGIGGAAAVLVAMLGALFFLPAIVAVMGPKVNALHVASLLPHHVRKRPRGPGIWSRICHRVMRMPHLTVAVALAFIVLAGLPFTQIHFTNPDYRILPASSQARQVGQALTHDFSLGDEAPINVVLTSSKVAASTDQLVNLYGYVQAVRKLPNVQRVDSLVSLPDGPKALSAYRQLYTSNNLEAQAAEKVYTSGQYTLVQVLPTTQTYAKATETLVKQLRTLRVHGFAASVGGQTAELIDLLDTIAHYGYYALGVILGAMLLLFFLMLGSIVIPLKTVLLNVLSLAASFGTLVWIFQMGHLSGPIGITPEGGIDATQPVIIFALAFGLSMDYAIFLFSRVKEHFDEHADIEKSIAWGVQRTGGIITSAALLLLVVIGAFAAGRIVVMKEVGIGLIVAVLVDVFIVRLLLVPASMKLLDKYNWWAPRPLRKLHAKLGIKESS